ncbi:helix-turn-helix domain-containing protein [Paenibacillus filicis]|uniref:Helix-turn-helix domain-containing protein n=1 Tax=Paenibacillus filicis TaxID=669464 RepID=A0ABU9DIP1_9BACL
MYKLMLVEDDYPVLQFLSRNIPWTELGIELIGMYENGLKALQAAESHAPDILITDIGIPKMNGLELIEAIKAYQPELLSIIISCHDKFEYAQKAISLSVCEYMLKESFDIDKVIQTLRKFKETLDHRSNASRQQKQDRQFSGKSALSIQRNRWMHTTLHNPIWNDARWKSEAAECGLDTQSPVLLPVLCMLNRADETQRRLKMSGDLLKFALANAMEELLEEYDNAIYFEHDARKDFILFSFQTNPAINIYDHVSAIMTSIQRQLRKRMSLDMSFIIGKPTDFSAGLARHLKLLFHSDEQYFYMEPGAVEKLNPPVLSKDDIFRYYYEALDEMKRAAISGQAAQMEATVCRWVDFIRRERFPSVISKEWINKVVVELQMKVRSLCLIAVDANEEFPVTMSNACSLQEMKDEWLGLVGSMMTKMKKESHGIRRIEILNAQRYVIVNIDKIVTLEELSSVLHLNPSYLSRLFKKETGENFVEYITKVKVEHAKELLDQTQLSVDEIAEKIGYEKNYFYKVFKKLTGMTPNHYRGYR